MRRRNGTSIRFTRVFAIAALAVAGQGCTTYLYKGAARPSAEVAVVTSNDTIVDSIDGVSIREYASGSFAHLELLPGPHLLAVSLNRVTPGLFGTNVARSEGIGVCVQLLAGHTYRTEPALQDANYAPVVMDLTGGQRAGRCQAPPTPPTIARAEAAFPPPPTPDEAGAQSTAAPRDSAADPGDAANRPAGDPPPGGESPDTVMPAATPPARHAAAVDAEDPDAAGLFHGTGHPRHPLPSDAVLAHKHPGNGLSLTFGGAFGGDEFVKARNDNGGSESLSSGSGGIAGIGLMLTPLWAGDLAGFGIGADASIKYDHLGAANGSASITRYPISLTGHVLFNVASNLHYIILKGGAVRDFGVNYRASGFADLDANVSGTWGPMGALGYYKKSNDVFGWDLLAFFALTKHVVGPDRINANSFGFTVGLHWWLP